LRGRDRCGLTHEGDHLAIELPFHDFYEVVPHDELVVVAELDDPIAAAALDERTLAVGERVCEQDGHHVLADRCVRLRRSSTGVLVAEQAAAAVIDPDDVSTGGLPQLPARRGDAEPDAAVGRLRAA
jgi:hypothetical protein